MFEPNADIYESPSRNPEVGPYRRVPRNRGWGAKAAGAVVMAGALALTACTSQPADPAANADGPLKIGVASIPATLDPGQNFQLGEYAIMNLVGGTLTNLNSDGKSVSMGLADTVTPGDSNYVVKLKPGLKFSDGSPLTATDVAASFEYYLADKANGYDYTFAPVQKVTATDDLTVNFELKRPYPGLEYTFTYPTSAVIPAKVIKEKGKDLYKGGPLPTAGKYQVTSFDANEVILEANPNYEGTQPSAKTLTFKRITDPAARLAQVQGGQLDYATQISPKNIPQLSGAVQARTAQAVNGNVFLGMNNRDNSVLSDVRIRKAISAAISRDQINQVAFAGKNTPALSLFGSSSKNNRPFLAAQPKVEEAKQLLIGTRCADGCTLRFIAASDDETISDIALIVQQNLNAIGIQVNIEKAEKTVLAQQANEGNYDFRASETYDAADTPGPFLAFVLGPTVKALRTGYSSPEVNQLIETIQATSGSQADSALDQLNAVFEKDLPMAPIANFMVVSASRVPAERLDLDPTLFFHVG